MEKRKRKEKHKKKKLNKITKSKTTSRIYIYMCVYVCVCVKFFMCAPFYIFCLVLQGMCGFRPAQVIAGHIRNIAEFASLLGTGGLCVSVCV